MKKALLTLVVMGGLFGLGASAQAKEGGHGHGRSPRHGNVHQPLHGNGHGYHSPRQSYYPGPERPGDYGYGSTSWRRDHHAPQSRRAHTGGGYEHGRHTNPRFSLGG
jgi:hypothetical protein